MPDDFTLHTPQSHGAKKFFLFLFLTLIGLFVLLFVFKFVSNLWILRYGSDTQKQALSEKINPAFTVSPEQAFSQRAKSSTIEASKLIRPYNPSSGDKNAPVTIVAFIDFECPYCQQSYPIFKTVMQEHSDVIRVVFKNFPIGAIHPDALTAAEAASCAQEQQRFWEYYDILFLQKVLDSSALLSYANTLGLHMTQFQDCLSSEKYLKQIQQDLQDGADVGVRGTPTFIVGNKKIEGVIDAALWDRVIVDALQKK